MGGPLLWTRQSRIRPDHHPVALGKIRASFVQAGKGTDFIHPGAHPDISVLEDARHKEFREKVNQENWKRVTCLHLRKVQDQK